MIEHARVVVGPLATNCWILKSGEELAVVDPGGDAPSYLPKKRDSQDRADVTVNPVAEELS